MTQYGALTHVAEYAVAITIESTSAVSTLTMASIRNAGAQIDRGAAEVVADDVAWQPHTGFVRL